MVIAVVFSFLAALGFSCGYALIRVGTQRVSAPTATFFTVITGAVLISILALILNLPGAPKAIRETIDEIFAAVPYCIDLIGGPYIETDPEVVESFRPKHARR